MKLRIPLFRSEIPAISHEIPTKAIAANQTGATIYSFAVPPSATMYVEVLLQAIDATGGDQAVYRIQQGVRNLTSKFAKAAQTLTVASADLANDETVTIGTTVYTLKTNLTASTTAYEVKVGANATATLLNLKNAINKSATGSGTTYGSLTAAHPSVTAVSSNATTLVINAIVPGTAGNSIATTETCGTVSWGAATMAGGVDAIALCGSNVLDAFETDGSWTAAIASDAPNGLKITVTSDGSNETVYSGVVNIYPL
jgi:hypothetical protein